MAKLKPQFDYDAKEKTVFFAGTLYFLKGRYEDGCVLGWHSDNPCGCTTDGDKGWAVFDLKKRLQLDDCETKMLGQSMSDDWRGWVKLQKEQHGKISYFKYSDGRHVWSMTRDT